MTTTAYDAIVIGAGQAGPTVAGAQAGAGRRTALIELDRLGGTCLNHGCKPTKALRASATTARRVQRASEFGVHLENPRVDFAEAMDRMRLITDKLRQGLADWLSGFDDLVQLHGHAELETVADGPHRVHLDGDVLTASEIYLDLGGRAAVPPVPGLDAVPFLTEVELLALTDLPPRLVIVGGGYVGCEFAQIFRRFGSEVTIVAGGRVAPREDPDVSQLVQTILEAEGVRILPGRTDRVAAHPGGVEVFTDDGSSVTGSHLLVATGRRPNIDLLGERHGLEVDARGFVRIDDRYATSVPGVWALGDINGHGAFTHTAYQDAQILLDPARSVARRVTTYAMFTDPPLGRVGMTIAEARASGRRILKAEVPMASVSRAILESETDGLMRILVDADSQEIVGATVLGLNGDDLVQTISFAMQTGVRYPQLRDVLPIHPTMTEFVPSILGSLEPLDRPTEQEAGR
jgi:pyruvate/2-oxoglutarate dehydrogenase complex dihydrolipoamide dehydrogenase (E3) component